MLFDVIDSGFMILPAGGDLPVVAFFEFFVAGLVLPRYSGVPHVNICFDGVVPGRNYPAQAFFVLPVYLKR